MRRTRVALLAISIGVIGLVIGGGLFVRVGAADSSYRKAVLFSEILSLVLENYVDPVEADRLLDGAYEGMLSGLDARAAFLTPAEVEEWTRETGDLSAGPGLSVLKSFGSFQVIGVDPGSPAAEASVEPGDQIRRIEGREVGTLSLDQFHRLLLGESGSAVEVEILHSGEGFRRETVRLSRRSRSVAPYTIDVRDGIAIVSPHDLARIDVERLTADLGDAASAGADRALVDLRNLVDDDPRAAAKLAGLFVRGELLLLRGNDGETLEKLTTEEGGVAVWHGAVAVLVNGATAGASEALARLLQVRTGATVYGEKTYGLGSEPRLFRLPDGSGVLVATDVWELSDGETWNRDGLDPDDEVRGESNDYAERLDEQLREALRRFAETPSAVEAVLEKAA